MHSQVAAICMLNASFVSHRVRELRLTKNLRRHSRFGIGLGSKHQFSDTRYGVFKFPRIYVSLPFLVAGDHAGGDISGSTD